MINIGRFKVNVEKCLWGLTAIIFAMSLVIWFCKSEPQKAIENVPEETTAVPEAENEVLNESTGSYIAETSFDGTSVLPTALFSFPFQRSDYYVSNKELAKEHSDTWLKNWEKLSVEYANTLYNINFRDALRDQEAFEKRLLEYLPTSNIWLGENAYTPEQAANILTSEIIENELIMSAELLTDKCLVYSDGCIWVRGELTCTVKSQKQGYNYELLGIDTNEEKIVSIVEFGYDYGGSGDHIYAVNLPEG